MRTLVLSKSGAFLGEVTLEQAEFMLGRGRMCNLRLDDRAVSSCHAIIRQNEAGVSIEDTASKNGTRLNGRTIQDSTPLQSNDVIQIGTYEIRYLDVGDTRSSLIVDTVPLKLLEEGQGGAPAAPPQTYYCALEARTNKQLWVLARPINTIGWSKNNMAAVYWREFAYFVARLEGADTLELNGVAIKGERQLAPGDQLKFGSTEMVLVRMAPDTPSEKRSALTSIL